MNELVKELQNYIIDETTRVKDNQCDEQIDEGMFHFYIGMAYALTYTLGELCRLYAKAKRNERKEVK